MYTNWLTSDISSKTRNDPNSKAPDCVIEVGPPPFARFPAHSSIISTQSGYFRAAISRINENVKLSENSIFLPNISVEHFTPLLTYMYTGYLELNFENIFGVLLATHLLHMPRALEICREFLSQTQQRQQIETSFFEQKNSKIIRPIASKPPSNYGLNFVSPPKAQSNFLLTSHGTTFKSISGEVLKPKKLTEDEKSSKRPPKPVSSPLPHPPTLKVENNDKVVIDIASCDGPVRFRRVLNEAYEQNKHKASTSTNQPLEIDQNNFKYQATSSSFHQQMVRNINEQYSRQKSANSGEESENSQQSIEIYTCVYCNHTFKSKYCYQKHAKRHINPLNPLGRCRPDDCESSDSEAVKQQQQVCVKRDSIKPLDMNVQYYPCKICGCKFPSYYFVHKHRKMCHPEVEADANGNLIQNSSTTMPNSLSQNQQSEIQINIDECSNKDTEDEKNAEEN